MGCDESGLVLCPMLGVAVGISRLYTTHACINRCLLSCLCAFIFHTESLSMVHGSLVAGTERELQLWPVLPTCQWQSWQVPGRGTSPWRLSVQWTRWLLGGMWLIGAVLWVVHTMYSDIINRFGRGCGPVIWQITNEWMNEWMLNWNAWTLIQDSMV